MLKNDGKTNIKVEPVKVAAVRTDYPCKDIFDTPHGGVLAFAVPNSGKSTLIHNLIDWMSEYNPETIEFVFFSGTFDLDPIYKSAAQLLKSRKVPFTSYNDVYTLMMDEKGKTKKYNLLELEANRCFAESKEHREKINKPKVTMLRKINQSVRPANPNSLSASGSLYSYNTSGPKKDEKKFREKVFIFDDISCSLDDEYLKYFVKMARHHDSRVIISTQDLLDIPVDFRNVLEHFIVFRGQTEDRLKRAHKLIIPKMDYNTFKQTYENLTRKEHENDRPFMYMSKNGDIRRNFTDKYKFDI